MSITNEDIRRISEEIIRQYGNKIDNRVTATRNNSCSSQNIFSLTGQRYLGVYEDMDTVIAKANNVQRQLSLLSLEERKRIIKSMREVALKNAEFLGKLAYEETGFGRAQDKKVKNILAAEKTPGVEDIESRAYTGDYGMTLVENAPYGVIGAITPSTNPSSTIINNSIGMIAAGNTVVYNPHPAAKRVSLETIHILNQAIRDSGCSFELLFSVKEPTIETSQQLMKHQDIRILVVTGGEGVVKVAMQSGKKVIAAGPGNPPVIVDNTANIVQAARNIVDGASFDNNVLCIAEKEVFVFREVADLLINNMINAGCYLARGKEIKILQEKAFENKAGKMLVNKGFVGKDASYSLEKSGIRVSDNPELIIAEVERNHPLVVTEMLMPVLPIVKVNNLEEAISLAKEAESQNYHTAIMHSENVTNLSRAARELNTTIFVKNAPSYAGLGYKGEGFTTLTIATPTGEGLTSARTFTRKRRCTLAGAFRII